MGIGMEEPFHEELFHEGPEQGTVGIPDPIGMGLPQGLPGLGAQDRVPAHPFEHQHTPAGELLDDTRHLQHAVLNKA